MEDIFIQALAERSKKDANLINQLPDDVRSQVEQKIAETEIQTGDDENPT